VAKVTGEGEEEEEEEEEATAAKGTPDGPSFSDEKETVGAHKNEVAEGEGRTGGGGGGVGSDEERLRGPIRDFFFSPIAEGAPT